jgi:hypothetical protein
MDRDVVERAAGQAAGQWGEDRNPKVITVRLEDGSSPAENCRREPRTEIARGVDRLKVLARRGFMI